MGEVHDKQSPGGCCQVRNCLHFWMTSSLLLPQNVWPFCIRINQGKTQNVEPCRCVPRWLRAHCGDREESQSTSGGVEVRPVVADE